MEEDSLTPDEQKEVAALIERTNKDKPKPEDVKALQAMLNKHPRLWRAGGDLAVQNQIKILNDNHTSEAAKKMINAGLGAMRKQLGYDRVSMLEQMLIEQVLLAWLRHNISEYKYTELEIQGMTLAMADFWERRLSASQRRYLHACESLARVCRLARTTPALQVNIATQEGQQVNIAGDFVKGGNQT